MSRETAEQLRSGVARGLNQSCWEDGFREGRAEGAEIVESLITPTFNRATWLRDRGCYGEAGALFERLRRARSWLESVKEDGDGTV